MIRLFSHDIMLSHLASLLSLSHHTRIASLISHLSLSHHTRIVSLTSHLSLSHHIASLPSHSLSQITHALERWGAGVETQKNVRGEIGGWGRVPFNETYAPSLSTIYDGA